MIAGNMRLVRNQTQIRQLFDLLICFLALIVIKSSLYDSFWSKESLIGSLVET